MLDTELAALARMAPTDGERPLTVILPGGMEMTGPLVRYVRSATNEYVGLIMRSQSPDESTPRTAYSFVPASTILVAEWEPDE